MSTFPEDTRAEEIVEGIFILAQEKRNQKLQLVFDPEDVKHKIRSGLEPGVAYVIGLLIHLGFVKRHLTRKCSDGPKGWEGMFCISRKGLAKLRQQIQETEEKALKAQKKKRK